MRFFSNDFFDYLRKHPLVRGFFNDFLRNLRRSNTQLKREFKQKKLGWYLGWTAFLGFLVMFFCATTILLQVADRRDKSLYDFEIAPGQTANEVIYFLKDQELVPNNIGINLLVSGLGLGPRVKAGHYELSPSMTVAEIVYKIVAGAGNGAKVVRLVVPEGTSIFKIGENLKKLKVKCATDFQQIADYPISPNLINQFPFLRAIKTNSLEGYLFPDTYFIRTDISATELAGLMLTRFQTMVIPFWSAMEGKTSLNLHQVITLASIIEKEAAYNFERPVISSVFYNRLRRGMGLAADPTIKYALENPRKKVSLKDLQVNSPYNTYKYRGLPPGPICNPGYYSIKAAILPDKTDYYFFVAQPEGTHIFSRTWAEHKKAINSLK